MVNQLVFFGVRLKKIYIGLAMAFLAPQAWGSPSPVADSDWVQSHWNALLISGEVFVEAHWVRLPRCEVRTGRVPSRNAAVDLILSLQGEVSGAPRKILKTLKTTEALQFITQDLEGDPGLYMLQFGAERKDLANAIQKENLRLVDVLETEVPYALVRIGIWQKNQCDFFILSVARED